MYIREKVHLFHNFLDIIQGIRLFVKQKPQKTYRTAKTVRYAFCLLLAEGLAVRTLVSGRVSLMGAHQDSIQRAEILALAMIGALLNNTLNTLVCFTSHSCDLLFKISTIVWPKSEVL